MLVEIYFPVPGGEIEEGVEEVVMSSQRVLLMIWVCLGVGLLGCEKAADEAAAKAIEQAIQSRSGGDVDAKISEGSMTIRTDDGEMIIATGGGVEVPAGFPKDVLVYAGASIVTAAKQGDSFVLNLTTNDDAKEVVDAYKSKMTSSGWEESESLAFGPQTMLSYRKEGNKAAISVATGDEGTVINLVVELAGE